MKHKHLYTQEAGMVSIIVTMIMMMVISLIVLGFSQIARRDQRQALDRQLSTQAYYAAESGVNDAVEAVSKGFTGNKTTCAPVAGLPSDTSVGSTEVSYSCLLIDDAPTTLEYSDIDTTNQTFAKFKGEDNSGNPIDITSIVVWWQKIDDSKYFADSTKYPNFPKIDNWNDGSGNDLNPVLRATVTKLGTSASLIPTRSNLITNTTTAFLYPTDTSVSSSDTVAVGGAVSTNGKISRGGCSSASTPKYCHVTFTVGSVPELFLQLKSIYSQAKVTVTAFNGGTQIRLKGAQIMVDSTGKAQDVLRRIQVRVPNSPKYTWPPSAVYSVQGICKLLNVVPGGGMTSVDSSASSLPPGLCTP